MTTVKDLIQKAKEVRSEGFLKHYAAEFAKASGAVSISKIAAECISILILIVVLVLIPQIGSAVEDNMPDIPANSSWTEFTDTGASTWGQISPLITVCVIVCLIGLVLKVIYDLRQN